MLEIRRTRVLRGPNIWADYPVIELLLDLGEYRDRSSEEIPGFNARLKSWLPSLIEHRCSVGERGGFFQRLERGTYLAHILEHVTLELQALAGTPVGFGRARETDEDGVYKVAIDFEEESLGLACVETARLLLIAAVEGRPFEVEADVARLRALAQAACLGPSTLAIARAARARRIPVRRLGTENLLQLGWGARQRRVWTAETDATGTIAEQIAQDKELTRMLLDSVGVPVPQGRPVASAEDAWAFAQSLGTPVVVKPRYGNHGRGVTAHLNTWEQVERAYALAREESRNVLCEGWVPGADHRLLVVGDRLVAAALREPAQVLGDGRSTVRELVDLANRDPRRSDGHATMLSTIKIDSGALSVLEGQGLGPDSVPPAGTRVLLRRNANLSTGGTACDVTERVHPRVAELAVAAARTVGLDIAGVDVLADDIGRPLDEQGGAVVEVNAGPGLRMHLEPSSGRPRPVGEAIVDLLFPAGEDGRIPLVAVGGLNGRGQVARSIAATLRLTEPLVGLASTDGLYVGVRRIASGDRTGPEDTRALLLHPDLRAAVLETSSERIRWEGLGIDRCLVAVVMALGDAGLPGSPLGSQLGTQLGPQLGSPLGTQLGTPLGSPGIETMEDLIRVERCLVEAVSVHGTAVLDAEDQATVEMAGRCRGSVCWIARDPGHPVVRGHRVQGGRAVVVSQGQLALVEGDREEPLVPLDELRLGPSASDGSHEARVRQALAVAAAAWALGLPPSVIRAGLLGGPGH